MSNIRTNFQHPSSYAFTINVCVFVVCFQVGFCFHAFLSVSDKSFDSRFVFVLIYCHTQTFFFAFSLALFLSVTLNVILYFTNRLQSNSSTQSPFLSLSHCNVCFYVSASFVFCIILDSVQSVFDLLCWLLVVKHTFNSSILYCICFPFFLSCFYTSVFVYVCVCAFKRRQMAHRVQTHTHTATHMHTRVCPVCIDWKPQTDAQLTVFSLVCEKFTMLLNWGGVWNEVRAIIG